MVDFSRRPDPAPTGVDALGRPYRARPQRPETTMYNAAAGGMAFTPSSVAHGPAPRPQSRFGQIEAPEHIHSGQLAAPPALMVEQEDRAQAEQHVQRQALREHARYLLPGRR
jgi:hypothetical protein